MRNIVLQIYKSIQKYTKKYKIQKYYKINKCKLMECINLNQNLLNLEKECVECPGEEEVTGHDFTSDFILSSSCHRVHSCSHSFHRVVIEFIPAINVCIILLPSNSNINL